MSTGRQDGREGREASDASLSGWHPHHCNTKRLYSFFRRGAHPHAQIIIDRSSSSEMAICFQREAHALNIATHVAVQLVARFLAATSNSDNGSDALHLRSGNQFTIWARSPLWHLKVFEIGVHVDN